MRVSWHDLWGCARGPVVRLAPRTRLLAGAGVFAASMIAPAGSRAGSAFIAAATLAWLAACRPPIRVVRLASLLGLALFLPYFLLVPIMPAAPPASSEGLGRALAVPWSILVRGISGMLVSIGTVASLTASDLREGIARLPVPRVASAILLQIVHQTVTLLDETRRVASAMAVRGASGGAGAAWRVLSSLPRVWLPRIVARAEIVAEAMELRGYCDGELPPFRQAEEGVADAMALALAAGAAGLAVAIRLWGVA